MRAGRGWTEGRVLVATAALTVAAVVISLLAIASTDVERFVPGMGPDCTVTTTTGDDTETTHLTQEQAEDLTAAILRGDEPRLRPAWLSCRHGGADDEASDRLDQRGLTARAAVVRRDLLAVLASPNLGGYQPGGVTSGHMEGSAHYEGRAIDVFFRPVNARNKGRGWALAQYLVAHADRLAIETVIFDGRIWTARRSVQGWRDYSPDTSGRSRQVARILEHRDHVHVDVAD